VEKPDGLIFSTSQVTTLKFRKVQKDSTKKSFDAYWTKQKPLEAQGSVSGE